MNVPRMIATDLDGTIVRSDGTISARTAAAFALVERAGSAFVMVTGRPPRWIHNVAAAIGHRGVAICANGALVYDLRDERVLHRHLIEPEAISAAIEALRDVNPELTFAVEYDDDFVFEARFNLGRWDAESMGGRPVKGEALVSRPGAKLLAFQPGCEPDVLMTQAVSAVGDLVNVTHSAGFGLIEMSAAGVSKASALSELCDSLGIESAEVVAFGDMPNDLPMLIWAGRSYAVANAHSDVLAMVDQKIASNDDDGVAQTLEELFA
jgi:Cof subfamily protein (haloacid dehalogenase superfamily)